jgi:PKD repeat protein
MNIKLINFLNLNKLVLLFVLFSFQAKAQHCSPAFNFTVDGYKVAFIDQSTTNGTIITWAWDFGDGSTSNEQNPSHTYSKAGTYVVCLNITDDHGCSSHICKHVVVNHPPARVCHAAFNYNQPDPNQQTINFTDLSTSDSTIGTWNWDFGDGTNSSEQNPIHTYAKAGTYTVCLNITDDDGGCSSHVCKQVVVHHPPAGICHALFSFQQHDPNQTTIDFIDESTSDGTIGTWLWNFGDGSTSTEQNPSHTYANPGTYTVCLNITDDDGGCTSHFCHHVTVHHSHHGLAGQSSIQLPVEISDFSSVDKNYIVISPNPFRTSSSIQYALKNAAIVCIEIYDMLGNKLSQISNKQESEGIHIQQINGFHLKPGNYFIKLTIGKTSSVKKITIEK